MESRPSRAEGGKDRDKRDGRQSATMMLSDPQQLLPSLLRAFALVAAAVVAAVYQLLVGFGSFSARRTANVTFAMIVSVAAVVRPFAGGAEERKRHVRYKSQSTAAVIYLPPPPPPPSLLFLPLPVVAVDGDDSRRRRHMAIIAPIQDRGGGQTNEQTYV